MSENGGHAFPDTRHDGMSLRDYFAGQALAGLLHEGARIQYGEIAGETPGISDDEASDRANGCLAMTAYLLADAMLAEKRRREKA